MKEQIEKLAEDLYKNLYVYIPRETVQILAIYLCERGFTAKRKNDKQVDRQKTIKHLAECLFKNNYWYIPPDRAWTLAKYLYDIGWCMKGANDEQR